MTALEYAKKYGYAKVMLEGEYKGYNVYVAIRDRLAYTGLPFFILEKEGEIKTLRTVDEICAMMRFLYGEMDMDDSEDEEE